jgi:hypothetical protein
LGFATGGLAGVGALYPATAGAALGTSALGLTAVCGCTTVPLLLGIAVAGGCLFAMLISYVIVFIGANKKGSEEPFC